MQIPRGILELRYFVKTCNGLFIVILDCKCSEFKRKEKEERNF